MDRMMGMNFNERRLHNFENNQPWCRPQDAPLPPSRCCEQQWRDSSWSGTKSIWESHPCQAQYQSAWNRRGYNNTHQETSKFRGSTMPKMTVPLQRFFTSTRGSAEQANLSSTFPSSQNCSLSDALGIHSPQQHLDSFSGRSQALFERSCLSPPSYALKNSNMDSSLPSQDGRLRNHASRAKPLSISFENDPEHLSDNFTPQSSSDRAFPPLQDVSTTFSAKLENHSSRIDSTFKEGNDESKVENENSSYYQQSISVDSQQFFQPNQKRDGGLTHYVGLTHGRFTSPERINQGSGPAVHLDWLDTTRQSSTPLQMASTGINDGNGRLLPQKHSTGPRNTKHHTQPNPQSFNCPAGFYTSAGSSEDAVGLSTDLRAGINHDSNNAMSYNNVSELFREGIQPSPSISEQRSFGGHLYSSSPILASSSLHKKPNNLHEPPIKAIEDRLGLGRPHTEMAGFSKQAGSRAYNHRDNVASYTRPPSTQQFIPSPHASIRHVSGVSSNQAYVSPILVEFRNNARATKRYELHDIYNHVVELSGDQNGSRFIQDKLETANSEEKAWVFREILPNAIPLMTDVFGNYIIQKFFELGDQHQKSLLFSKMSGQMMMLSNHVYGCRVVQSALQFILVEQQISLIRELESDDNVMRCVRNQNGNHVVQAAIEHVDPEYIPFILNHFIGKVRHLATDLYGCRVIQRLLKYWNEPGRSTILNEVLICAGALVSDQYGNYVIQHILEHEANNIRQEIVEVVRRDLVNFSKQKFASNVVEKCITCGSEQLRRDIMMQLAVKDQRGQSCLTMMIRDAYGNYVIQKLLDTLNESNYMIFVDVLTPEVARVKRLGPNKQADNVAKKMHRFDRLFRVENETSRGTGFLIGPASGFCTNFSAALPTPPPTLQVQVNNITG